MMVAFGTLTPTSTTVVATSTQTSPSAKAAMTASFSPAAIRPCTSPTPGPRASRRASARSSAAVTSRVSDSETSGQIQKAWAPAATAALSRRTTSSSRVVGAMVVSTGLRLGGFSSMRETSRSP